jgi:hypothetical protein
MTIFALFDAGGAPLGFYDGDIRQPPQGAVEIPADDRDAFVAAPQAWRWRDGARVAVSPPLADRKTAALAALAARRWRAETSGVVVAGYAIRTDEQSQSKLTAAVVAATLDPDYVVRWKLSDGSFAVFNAATIIAVGQGVRAHVQACFDHEAALATEIVAAVDADALAAIDLDSGWPA